MKEQERRQDVVVHPPHEPKIDNTFEVDISRKTWTSCCFECDREVVLYMTKTSITVATMIFAMYRIASHNDPCKELSFEHGLIGMIAGSFIEQGHQRMVKK